MEEKELKCDYCGADLNEKVEVETTHLGTVKRSNIGRVVHDEDGNITKAVCKKCYKEMKKDGRQRNVGGGYKDLWS